MRRISLGALALAGALCAPVIVAGPAGAANTPPSGQSGGPSAPAPGGPQSQPPTGPTAPPNGDSQLLQFLNQLLGGGGGKG
jgi:hypothetical protein